MIGKTAADQAVRVELLGPARLLAGRKELALPVDRELTVGEVLGLLAHHCPTLAGPVVDAQRQTLTEGYILNRNGRDFLSSPDALIRPGDRLLLLASSAGG